MLAVRPGRSGQDAGDDTSGGVKGTVRDENRHSLRRKKLQF